MELTRRVRVTISVDVRSDVTGDFAPSHTYAEWAQIDSQTWVDTDGSWQGTLAEAMRDIPQALTEVVARG